MSKPIEPSRCVCGRKATVMGLEVRDGRIAYGVRCRVVCWFGPIRATRTAAVLAWNRVMVQAVETQALCRALRQAARATAERARRRG